MIIQKIRASARETGDGFMKGRLLLFGAFTLAGTSVVAAKSLAGRLGPFTIAAMSLLFALGLLLPVCGGRWIKAVRGMSKRAFGAAFLQAFFGMFLFRALLIHGVSRTSSAEAGVLTGATPAITALLAWVVLKEPAGRRTLTGISATVLGVLFVQGLGGQARLSAGHIAGNIFVLCAAASESVFNILSRISASKKTHDRVPLDPPIQTALVSAIALILCLVPALMERPLAHLSAIALREWLSLGWYGVFVTALSYLCWYAGIKRSDALTAAAFSGMIPLTSMLLSTLVLGERPGLSQWTGGVLVVVGMALIGLGGTKRNTIERMASA